MLGYLGMNHNLGISEIANEIDLEKYSGFGLI